ncbi:dipicolinate synthase subunit B [Heliorestis acidaminivorans]|uniref:Dipicolinate synthase subunit B n=1 Tax=Heliorestis acidaminivorans TaxID=553427 RepID=A0A6I0F3K8_9FIRM|nr:dipicolinate synthase subunit B [Heliorestis acidaminivorans]KAB2954340.1 dipicolinate synthase subunit B [Heliorestis acidaminivorans]
MRLKGKTIGFAITGSHCTIAEVIPIVKELIEKEGAVVIPIFSETVLTTDTRFGKAEDWKKEFETLTGQKVITSIVEAEPIGPRKLLDVMVVAPCTGNTIAKLANSITDTTVLMAVKAQLRNLKPVVLAISTNDGLAGNLKNLGHLMNAKNIFMVPFGQDSPTGKANSIVAKMELLPDTIVSALENRQIQPLLVNK